MARPSINVNVYGKEKVAGATFGVGATDLASIKEMTTARDNLSKEQSTPTRGPVRRD